jgi:preprotein translocase subunit SecG
MGVVMKKTAIVFFCILLLLNACNKKNTFPSSKQKSNKQEHVGG